MLISFADSSFGASTSEAPGIASLPPAPAVWEPRELVRSVSPRRNAPRSVSCASIYGAALAPGLGLTTPTGDRPQKGKDFLASAGKVRPEQAASCDATDREQGKFDGSWANCVVRDILDTGLSAYMREIDVFEPYDECHDLDGHCLDCDVWLQTV